MSHGGAVEKGGRPAAGINRPASDLRLFLKRLPYRKMYLLFFRPFGAALCRVLTHGLRRGLYSFATSWLWLVRPTQIDFVASACSPDESDQPGDLGWSPRIRSTVLARVGPRGSER